MDLLKSVADHLGEQEEKFFKSTLFRADSLLLGLNCLNPGQVQQPHAHADQDKFYYVIEGGGRFWIGQDRRSAVVGDVVWAPAGIEHGVENDGDVRLSLLVGIAPAP